MINLYHVFSKSLFALLVTLILIGCFEEKEENTEQIDSATSDSVAPQIEILGASTLSLALGESFSDPGAIAMDDQDGKISVETTGKVDTNKAGTYVLTYSATDSSNNTVTLTRTIHIVDPSPIDSEPPVITLQGDNPMNLFVGDTFDDPGATAMDAQDRSLAVITINAVSTDTPGTYTLTYQATDSASNTTTVRRTINVIEPINLPAAAFSIPDLVNSSMIAGSDLMVTVTFDGDTRDQISHLILYLNETRVRRENIAPYEWGKADQDDPALRNLTPGDYALMAEIYYTNDTQSSIQTSFQVTEPTIGPDPTEADTTAPTVTLIGGSNLTIAQGDEYKDQGASALDETDGPVPVLTSGNVDTQTPGEYSITYTASDTSGNIATATRIVTVETANAACVGFGSLVDNGPLATETPCGMQYRRHAVIGESEAIHIIPDFSHAGYQGGGVAIPDVPTVVTLSPLANEDDTQQIQAAINSVSARTPDENGFRGAVLLNPGEYDISTALSVTTSGVVIRGAGQRDLASGGTQLRAKTSITGSVIVFSGTDDYDISGSSRVSITSDYVPVGSKTFEVADASNFSIGDYIGVQRTPNNQWLSITGMDSIISGGVDESWSASSYAITHLRTITSVSGNSITVDIPIVDSIQQTLGGGNIALADRSERIHSCGLEDIRIVSDYSSDTDENHARTAVTLRRAEHCWVRRITGLYLVHSLVSIDDGFFNTVEEAAIADFKGTTKGGRRYSFNVSGSSVGNLFQRCYSSDGRHNFVTGSRVPGPNVWLDCLAENSINDDGPHHRWATGLLFDNIETLQLHVQNRFNSGSGHGWSGAQVAFWNPKITSESVNTSNAKSASLIVDAAHSSINWAIGTTGDGTLGTSTRIDNQPQGSVESFGNPVAPRSLYLAQLKERLGATAVEATTIPEQREGNIWNILKAWKGNGLLSNYLTE